MNSKTYYNQVPTEDTSSTDEREESQAFPLVEKGYTHSRHEDHGYRWSRTVLLSFGLHVLFTIVGALVLIKVYSSVRPTDLSCAKQLSIYSPMAEAIEYEELDWDNEFFKTSLYMGTPTEEGDAAWEELWDIGEVNIPFDKLHLLNRTADDLWKLTPPEAGGGVAANFEVFHLMHCLNKIRQYTYLDSYETPPKHFTGSPRIARIHVDHCIESFRLFIMCQGDVTPLLIRSDPTNPLGDVADFSNHHKCRKFDKLWSWMKTHAVPRG